MTSKTVIVAHVDREAMAQHLAGLVNADKTFFDDGTLGCELNHKQAWQWLADNNTAEWSVVLEDDSIPVEDFQHQLSSALRNAPTPVVSLYLGRSRPPQWQMQIGQAVQQAEATDAHWIIGTGLHHAVGVAIRTEHLPDMLDWVCKVNHPIDESIGHWARLSHKAISYTHPSLLEHADGVTLAIHRDKFARPPGRVAWKTGTRCEWDRDRRVVM